jgi:hypothetical protein
VRERLREKLPGEGRSKSIDILFGEFKFCELARKKPYKSWLALLQSFGCPRPVTISLVNTQLAEMYFEDKDTATAMGGFGWRTQHSLRTPLCGEVIFTRRVTETRGSSRT